MSKNGNTFNEAAAIGQLRSELISIQFALDHGAKRTAAQRVQSWGRIASEALARVRDITEALEQAKKQPELPKLS